MTETASAAALSFFTVNQYHYSTSAVCNFENAPRPHFCMGLVLQGRGCFTFQGRQVEVEPGEIIFVPLGSRYVSRWSGSPDITYISMHFSFFSHTRFPGDKALCIQKIPPADSGEFEALFSRALCDYERDGNNFSSLACFYEVMSRILPRLLYDSERKYDERIHRVAQYIENHYSENIGTKELASIGHMSISHFHTTFKSVMGVTPIEYRNSIRIRLAITYLIRGEDTVEAISDALGFESAAYFRRVFKKEMGCPPSRYTEKHMEM